ncbi:MAG: LysM peptidoglycan-binding domain-containing protein [Nitrospiraceae bacterium]|nr:MAG: LysM peptidoglycan-binding domain-containing protein [Nitrospiraceae bacterium]
MKTYHALLLIGCFLLFSLPVAASTGVTPSVGLSTVQIPDVAILPEIELPAEKEGLQLNGIMVAAVSLGEKPAGDYQTAPAFQEQEISSAATSEKAGYNLQAYHSNEVALKAVERNIGLFSNTIKDRFSLWLSRSGKYIDMMKEILRQKDVPENIVFLSLIESGFSPNAYSVAHAAGPWQFIASTAKRYGLEINWWKDERRDPVKSTGAAADYLKDLHNMFGSWNLAMAAYNAGEGRIQKAMKRSNADNYWALLGTSHIKTETKEYVPRFIAANLIAANPQEFGFGDIEYHEPLSFDEVELDSPLDLSVAAECAGTTLEEMKRLNPELRRWCTPPDTAKYQLRIPVGTKEQFLAALAYIPENDRFTIDRYTVKKGDTFARIAKKTGIPVSTILSLNSLEKIMPLKSGSVIYIPPKDLYRLDSVDKAMIKKASYHKKATKKSISKKAAKKRVIKKVSAKKKVRSKKAKKI